MSPGVFRKKSLINSGRSGKPFGRDTRRRVRMRRPGWPSHYRTSVPTPRKRTRSRRTAGRRGPSVALFLLLAVVAVVVLAYLQQARSGRGGTEPDGPVPTHDAELIRRQLADLPVAAWASMRGYSRDRFYHWSIEDGCDVRQRVLVRDGEDVVVDDECRVTSGTWVSPFDGVTLTDPGTVDVDHMVPLANAWRTGAAEWAEDRRVAFANDLDTPQLIAVSATSNRAKGDQDPSQWRPPERDYWCRYAQNWVAVKYHWELWVTAAEKDALADMLDTCG